MSPQRWSPRPHSSENAKAKGLTTADAARLLYRGSSAHAIGPNEREGYETLSLRGIRSPRRVHLGLHWRVSFILVPPCEKACSRPSGRERYQENAADSSLHGDNDSWAKSLTTALEWAAAGGIETQYIIARMADRKS